MEKQQKRLNLYMYMNMSLEQLTSAIEVAEYLQQDGKDGGRDKVSELRECIREKKLQYLGI